MSEMIVQARNKPFIYISYCFTSLDGRIFGCMYKDNGNPEDAYRAALAAIDNKVPGVPLGHVVIGKEVR